MPSLDSRSCPIRHTVSSILSAIMECEKGSGATLLHRIRDRPPKREGAIAALHQAPSLRPRSRGPSIEDLVHRGYGHGHRGGSPSARSGFGIPVPSPLPRPPRRSRPQGAAHSPPEPKRSQKASTARTRDLPSFIPALAGLPSFQAHTRGRGRFDVVRVLPSPYAKAASGAATIPASVPELLPLTRREK